MKHYLHIVWMSLSLVLLSIPQGFAQSDYYRRHYVIVVDQGVIQRHPNTPLLYKDIKELFVQNTPLSTQCNADEFAPHFDERCDQISILASGISYDDYMDLWESSKAQKYNPNDITNIITGKLFHPVKDFQSSNVGLSEFLDKYLRPLTNGTWKSNNLVDCHLGLNEYLYPLILYKLDAKIPSENYFFLIVSNFTAQGAIHTVHAQQVEPMLRNQQNYISAFDCDVKRWESYFYENDFAKGHTTRYAAGIENTAANVNNEPKVNFFKLGVKSLEGVGISIQSSPQYSQEKLHGSNYSSTNTTIVFNHPDNLMITDVWADIQSKGENVSIKYTLGEDVEDRREGDLRIYEFKNKNKINLGDLQPADQVATQYHFSSTILKSDGTPLLPMNFSASCSYIMQKNDFVPEPEKIPGWAKILLLIVVASSIFTPLYYIYRRRGRRIKAEIEDLRFVPVSRERYMDVSNMKVKEYDCWYMDPEAQKTQVKLEVKGVLRTTQRTFAKDTYRARLEFKVMDIDFDDNFTFRPIGKDNNAIPYQVSRSGEDHWYLVETNEKGEFTVPIMAYLDTEKHPELKNIDDEFWKEDHILKTQIDFRAIMVHRKDTATLSAKKLDTVLVENEIWPTHPIKIYEFIARPTFNLRDSWIAFDPGTSGACAAFITGGNIDNPDNIHVVHELVSYTGKEVYEPVYPSKIIISDNAKAFRLLQPREEITEVRSWEEGTDQKERIDFIFGWYAARLITKNSFQSIKKLLGYTNTQSIINKEGKELQIGGKLLAQLLVKGLYAHAQRYIMDLQQNPKKFNGEIPHQPNPIDIQNQYFDNGSFAPKKAIVAVPNNYTLPKIQEMVDTVKALGQFKEVHYLYESEGILMEYCHRNWHHLDEKANKLIMVFDMGGATINATAFKLTNITKDKHNNITDIVLKTVGKIGYCVGGDDIDYAIIRQIYNLSVIKALYATEKDIKRHMAAHKQLLIKLARELKLAIIAKNNNQPGILDTPESFHNHILSYSKDMGWPEENVEFTETDNKTWMNPVQLCQKSKILKEFVYAKIADSVQELFASMTSEYQTLPIEIIFGGRSTLFPYVTDTVIKALPQGNKPSVWDGLMKDGILDANAVKTAVASGACWYANFSQHITIEHNIITTAFGYIDYKEGKEIFVPMIQAGDKFKNGLITKKTEPYSANLLQQVVFVQMQGANHEKILEDFRNSKEQKHKMNILDKVKPDSDVTNIGITLDERFNFEYEITTASGVEDMTPKNYPFSRLRFGSGVKTEIADENNESYMFAAISSQEEIKEQQHVIKEASTSIKTNNNRF